MQSVLPQIKIRITLCYYVNCIKRDQNKAVVNPAYPKKAYIEAMSAIANNNTFRTLISVSFLR